MYFSIDENGIKHFGIKGMKWGVRRYQNEDGSLTPAGKRRYGYKDGSFKTQKGQLQYEKERTKDIFQRKNKELGWPNKEVLKARTASQEASTNYSFEKRKKKYAKVRELKKSPTQWERLSDSFGVYNISANKAAYMHKNDRNELNQIYKKDYNLQNPVNRARVKEIRKNMSETQVRLMEELIGKYPGKDRERIISRWTNYRDEDYDG